MREERPKIFRTFSNINLDKFCDQKRHWDAIGIQKGNYALRDVINIALFKLHSSGWVDGAWKTAFNSDMLMKVPAQPYF